MSFHDELNFRDLGGLKTNDGRELKKGYFYRGAALSFFNEDELKEFADLSIRTIMDLRSKKEAEEMPDPYIEGTDYIEYSGLVVKGNEDIDWSPAGMCKIGGEARIQLEKIKGYYRNIAIGNKAYKIMMDRIVNDEVPLYFHCATGKDRTGVAAMIILLALNVKTEEIRKDYLLSNEYRKKAIEKGLASVADLSKDHPEINELIMIQEGVLESTFDTVISSILDRYGDFSTYLKEEFSLDEDRLKTLRERFLQ